MTEAATVNWIPAIAVLACGLVVGSIFLMRLRSQDSSRGAGNDALEIRDLVEKKEALIQQLRDLEDSADAKPPEQTAQDRYALELETARVMQSIEGLPVAEPAASIVAAPAVARRQSASLGFLWGMATMAAVAGLVYFVSRSAQNRANPSAPITGGQEPAAEPGVDMDALVRAVQRNPDNLDAHLNLAYAYLVQRDMMKVYQETSFVLERSPGNARALSYQALVRLTMGEAAEAERMLKEAIRNDPNLLDGWIHLAIVYAQTGRMKEAEEAIAEATRRHPEEAATLQEVMTELRSSAPGNPPATSTDSPSSPRVASAGGGEGIAGEVDIDSASRKSIPPGALVFVIARDAGSTGGGPPKAVTRMAAGTFPLHFELSSANSMMGQPLPSKVRLEARIDSDGDPLTRQDSDLSGVVDNIALGASSVKIVVK